MKKIYILLITCNKLMNSMLFILKGEIKNICPQIENIFRNMPKT